MIDLTDTTRENGCLRVILGSHRHDHPLHHLEAAHSAELQGVLNPDNPAFAAHPDEVAVPVPAGDVLVVDARLIHSAYGNATGHERPLIGRKNTRIDSSNYYPPPTPSSSCKT